MSGTVIGGSVAERDVVAPPAGVRGKVSRKRLLLTGAAILAVMGAAWFGHGYWTEGRFIETTDDAYVSGDTTTISPHVAGFVTRILVTDNQHVEAGQLLARLDGRDFQAAVDRDRAIVDARRANLANLEAQIVLQNAAIRQADADFTAKSAHAAFTREDSRRYASLVQSSAGSRQDAQKAQAVDLESGAAVQSSQAGLEAARQQLNVLATRIAEAGAAIAQANADLDIARLNLGYTEIRAPIDGYVGNRAARVGAYVASGAYLLSVIPARGLWVDANFKEDQLALVRVGQSASLVADVAPGRVFHGHVLSLAPGTGAVFSIIPPENATGNFTKIVQRVPVRIVLDDADGTLGTLRPGLSTTVRVDTRTAPAAAP